MRNCPLSSLALVSDYTWQGRKWSIRKWNTLKPHHPSKMCLLSQVLVSVSRSHICMFAVPFFFHVLHSPFIQLLGNTRQSGIKVWVIVRVFIILLECYSNIQYSMRKKLSDSCKFQGLIRFYLITCTISLKQYENLLRNLLNIQPS